MGETAKVIGPGEGQAVLNPVGGHVTFKVRGEDSDGELLVLESVIAPGDGPPLHTHAREHEVLYVLDGEFRFQLGDEVRAAPVGTTMFVTPGVPHCFQNVGTAPGTLLVSFTPAGMERFFELAEGDREAFVEAGRAAGMEVVGPPLAQRPG